METRPSEADMIAKPPKPQEVPGFVALFRQVTELQQQIGHMRSMQRMYDTENEALAENARLLKELVASTIARIDSMERWRR